MLSLQNSEMGVCGGISFGGVYAQKRCCIALQSVARRCHALHAVAKCFNVLLAVTSRYQTLHAVTTCNAK